MGRKSREKRLRKQEGRAAPTPAQEMVGDIPHEKVGQFLVPKQEFSPEALKAEEEKRRQRAPHLPGLISAQVAELRGLLTGVSAPELLSALALEVFAVDVDRGSPSFSERPWIYVEFPTWLYLTSPSTAWEGGGPLTRQALDRVLTHEDSLLELTRERSVNDHLLKGREQPSIQDELLARARGHQLVIRQPLYVHQLRDQQLKLFEVVREQLRRLAGFDIDDAWELFRHLANLLSRRLAAVREALGGAASLRAVLDSAPRSVAELYKVKPSQLAEVSRRSEDEARAFLKFFSLAPGQAAVGDNSPNLYEPLELSPLVDLGGDVWLVHLAPKLPSAFKLAFEKLLKTEARAWNLYEKARGRYLEERSLEFVSRCSQAAKSWGGLAYEFDEGDGRGARRFELDGLIAVDTVLFLIEAKAGSLRGAARRGAPSAMEDLGALVSEAYQQATRAFRFIKSMPRVRFFSKSEGTVEIVGEQFTRVVLLTTTLDDLAAYVTRLSDLVEVGVLPEGPLPWAVALHDLEVMTELAEGMGQLVHYVERRHAAESIDLLAATEMDLFAGYLLNGLRFEGAGAARVLVPDLTGGIEDYYAYRNGLRREPAPKPRRRFPAPVLRFIQHLESSAPPGFIEAICALHELRPVDREAFMEDVGACHGRAAKTGFSAFVRIAGEQVLAFASGKEFSREVLAEYTRAVKYLTRRDRAVGIMQVVGKPGLLDIVVELGAWREDPQLQETSMAVLERYTV
ncbi:hypothetical protein ACN28E_55125 [Archangium lansingense]|uniref:hypothetical protein n=1 Tax=Archangium lansingense TaxID=2995310 RepID=UPI003B7A488C